MRSQRSASVSGTDDDLLHQLAFLEEHFSIANHGLEDHLISLHFQRNVRLPATTGIT